MPDQNRKMIYGTLFIQQGQRWVGDYLDSAGSRYTITIYVQGVLWRARWVCKDCGDTCDSPRTGVTWEEAATEAIRRIPVCSGNHKRSL